MSKVKISGIEKFYGAFETPGKYTAVLLNYTCPDIGGTMSKVEITGLEMCSLAQKNSGILGAIVKYTDPDDGNLKQDIQNAKDDGHEVFLTTDPRIIAAQKLIDTLP